MLKQLALQQMKDVRKLLEKSLSLKIFLMDALILLTKMKNKVTRTCIQDPFQVSNIFTMLDLDITFKAYTIRICNKYDLASKSRIKNDENLKNLECKSANYYSRVSLNSIKPFAYSKFLESESSEVMDESSEEVSIRMNQPGSRLRLSELKCEISPNKISQMSKAERFATKSAEVQVNTCCEGKALSI